MNNFIWGRRIFPQKIKNRIFPPTCKTERGNNQRREEGQTFFEFIFLMLILIILSFTLIRGFSTGIGDRWTAIIQIVAKPTDSPIELN